jgi:hypothetical protein
MTPLLASLGLFDYGVLGALLILFYALGGSAVQRADLRRLDRKLDALLKHQGISLSPVVSEDVQGILLDRTKKPEAIKLHREQTGLGEEDATADVEAFLAGKE